MGASESWVFKPGSLKVNLKRFNGSLSALISGVVDYRTTNAISYMKTSAPWTDRTGNARATLNAEATHSLAEQVIRLFGGMPYQIWLEVRHAGRFAIIGPAVKYQGLALMNQLRGLMNKLGKL